MEIRPISPPLFVLGAPRSFTSVVASMIGQHPQMYGLPEVQLFFSDTVAAWSEVCLQAAFPMADGLVRAVAELIFGEQTAGNVLRAQGWIRRRYYWTTGQMLEALADAVTPRIAVEKSPSMVFNKIFLRRMAAMFPEARYIHLVRHPRGNGESVLKAIREIEIEGTPMQWLIDLASYATIEANQLPDPRNKPAEMDPQRGWYVLNQNIRTFLRSVPPERKLLIRGEEVLSNPDEALRNVAAWMNLRTDAEAIEAMKHPEESPFARLGPEGAQYGNDPFFIRNPAIRATNAKPLSLEGKLEWLSTGDGFLPEVKTLATEFGYA